MTPRITPCFASSWSTYSTRRSTPSSSSRRKTFSCTAEA
ncbi:hypothetical protein SY1_20140 [Fretibacterium fastidiosum]|uniref:Uncharacterized protein n=1 Tax=Fretibacterium fastidiosum TaxID=651822 RepID=A0AB94IYL5_9BACT|nr:hypothetical protein SY1_20140 [Fretibacterium fastidiosum]